MMTDRMMTITHMFSLNQVNIQKIKQIWYMRKFVETDKNISELSCNVNQSYASLPRCMVFFLPFIIHIVWDIFNS